MKFKRPVYFDNINLVSIILLPLTLITLTFNLFKKLSLKEKFKIKTICVGNIYLGGTGKTPLVLKIDKILKNKFKTVIIKKKYLDQEDEQKILKQNNNLICLDYRKKALINAVKKNYKVAILDDGLQEKGINYDISIACFNSSDAIGNGFLLPAGPLRENLGELRNYDAVFLNGEKNNIKFLKVIKKIKKKLKIFQTKYVPINLKSFDLNKNYLFFCGLGNPKEFERTLLKYKFKIKKKIIFPDHYNFSNEDIGKIKKIAKYNKLDIITSEKDYLRLNKMNKKNIKFLKVELKIKDNHRFKFFLRSSL